MSLREVMTEGEIYGALGVSPRDCEGSRFHSPRPLGTRRVVTNALFEDHRPTEHGKPQTLHLCGTCLDNLRVFVRLCIVSNGALPWETRREFGNVIRRLGQEIWSTHYEENRA